MARSVKEWIGKTDDTAPPPRVRLRVFDRYGGHCHACTRVVRAGQPWTLEHIVALINGGANKESNLGISCSNCLPMKNAADLAEKSVVARKRKKDCSTKTKGRGFWRPPGSTFDWSKGRYVRP